MAAYDIQKHFQGLRVDTGRRRGRRDPFATGFEDDSDDDRQSRAPKKAPPVQKPVAPPKDTNSSPFAAIDALRDSDDDFVNFTSSKTQKKTGQRSHSPAPAAVATARRGSIDNNILPTVNRNPRTAVVLAAGPLAYLDDSDEDDNFLQPSRRTDRRPSPAPRKQSDPLDPLRRSSTPRGSDRGQVKEHSLTRLQPSRHTVASPFAGTKYLEDSDSSEDETAVASRKNSAEPESSPDENDDTNGKQLEVQRVDKPKSNGSGVSWRAFSASRSEQRSAEVEALQASLRQRGRTISFSPHATTDDGKRIPVSPTFERPSFGARGRGGRGKSPPRRVEDIRPSDEDPADGGFAGFYDPVEYKTNPFTATSREKRIINDSISSLTGSPTSSSITLRKKSEGALLETSAITDSLAAKLTVSPQTIPETSTIDHAISPVTSPTGEEPKSPLSRHGSYRSVRAALNSRPARIPASSRRSSRRSTSTQTSISPAHAFLSSWSRSDQTAEAVVEPKPDDEGQAVGLDDQYIIGRMINRGGFGVVKEVHSIDEHGRNSVRAVKIVRKTISDVNEAENEKLQQALEHEVSVWRYLEHRHVLGLHAVYDTDFATFCVMDLNIGGTLFEIVRKSRANAGERDGRKGLPSHLARTYSYQLACALRYLHEDIRVCHRDVKLENCLVDLTVPDAVAKGGNLRLCDFGLADFLHNDQNFEDPKEEDGYTERLDLSTELPVLTANSLIGTLEYASPKGLSVNRKLYETAGDVWAFGVVVYALCTGDLPFRHPIPSKTAELIMRAEWDNDGLRQVAAGGSEVIDLVKGCLERDIDLRFTISDALKSSWFDGCREEGEETTRGGWN